MQHPQVVADGADRESCACGQLSDVGRSLDVEQLGEPAPQRVVEGDQERCQRLRRVLVPGSGVEVSLCGCTTGHATRVIERPAVPQGLLYNSLLSERCLDSPSTTDGSRSGSRSSTPERSAALGGPPTGSAGVSPVSQDSRACTPTVPDWRRTFPW